ncbi:MAG: hypothetical protein HY817_03725 [Candidatus Abawacabacteria bacterium]|nr:hypothetical protein [Candidatus Abawacabacteria bacterium]
MLPFIIAYLLILIIWAVLSSIAIRQVYQNAYQTDRLSRNLTIIYIVISIFLAINGLRILMSLDLTRLFT